MKRILRIGMIAGTAMVALAACDDSDGGGDGGQAVGGIEDNFGAGFAEIFRQDRNDEPIEPEADDIVAVDRTADPIDF